MEKKYSIICLILLLAFFSTAAIGLPTVDGATEESAISSLGEVRESLPESEREKFEGAIMRIALHSLGPNGLIELGQRDDLEGENPLLDAVLPYIEGMNGEEVIEYSEALTE